MKVCSFQRKRGGYLRVCGFASLMGALLLSGCSHQAAESGGMRPTDFRVPVTVAAAAQQNVPIEVKAIGNVEASSTVAVKTQVAGQIEKVYFTEGQDAKSGQLLFTLDARPFEARLRQLEANLARDQAELKNAKAQAERAEKLNEAGIISREQYDTLRTNAEALEATVLADQAAITSAKVDLSYCSVYSPLSGRAGALMVHPGNLVKANDSTVVIINQIHPIYVSFTIPENSLATVKQHRKRGPLMVEARIPSDTRPPSKGVLTFIDNSVDTATGTIRMRGTFQNPDGRLWPGQFVHVAMQLTSRPNATVVPSQAVQTGMAGKYLFVIKQDMSADFRQVVTGETVGSVTVIEQGVKPGETVVTDGQLLLAPGSKVEIKKGA